MSESIIRIGKLGLSQSFLSQTEEQRKKICLEILEKGFKHSDKRLGIERKREIISNLLVRSIKQLEIEESYEEANILLQIQNTIPIYVSILSTQNEENP